MIRGINCKLTFAVCSRTWCFKSQDRLQNSFKLSLIVFYHSLWENLDLSQDVSEMMKCVVLVTCHPA